MESVVIDLLRTPELQRLRKIRQMGLVHLVFPCAEHSRLAHALGLSSAEGFLSSIKWHELVGHGLLNWPEGQLHRLLEQHEQGASDRISRLLRGEYYIPYMPRLLASDLDVDRADFIRRDTYQTGVAYGRYDLDWLISTCCIGERREQRGRSEWVIGFDAWKAVRDGYRPTGGGDFTAYLTRLMNGETFEPHELLKLDDFAVWILVDIVARADGRALKDDTLRDLARRITARDLFKRVRILSDQLQQFLLQPHAQEQIQEVVKPFCPGDPEFYVFVDQASFEMLSGTESEWIYLVDDFKATPMLSHPHFRHYRDQTRTTVRVYTVREAIPAVEKLVRDRT